MGLADSLTSVGGDLLTGWLNNSAADARQEDAQAFSAQQFASRYQTTVKDLQSAGLNPMLAYMQGGGSPPSSTAASSSGIPSLGQSFNQGKIASAQEANLQAQTTNTGADTQLKEAQRQNVDADTLIKGGMPDLIAAQVVQASASAAQSAAMAAKITAEIPQVEHQINLLKAQAAKADSDISVNNSLIEANRYLNGLRTAQTYLASADARQVGLTSDILDPKAKAAGTVTGKAAAHAENVSKIGGAFWDTVGGFMKKPSLVINQTPKGK